MNWQIYLGTITNWKNVSASLPDAQIAVAYQSCTGSGILTLIIGVFFELRVDIFTTALAAMSSSWTNMCSVGHQTNGDKDILEYVMNTPNAIGYPYFSA